ncbi:NAD(P)H-hydrate dehydratase [uncultured Hydrogenophaga sp.]|uniref:NAD(P)H-hydrate dehydratase n=1 Tax=uncultured Hydrogenophaga sp. TaxID=199683 RepID=UPI002588BA62|nr:NAD(P)H-hydrate dehydratase [uncultured Hydrogenophaga sp.]
MRALRADQPEALHDTARTREIEQARAASLPPHTLMARAGEAVARLALAWQPHARRLWVACGPGNNGGDGLVAARHLLQASPAGWREIVVTHDADAQRLPPDAAWALREAVAAGVTIQTTPPDAPDLIIDALLGIGARAPGDDALTQRVRQVRAHHAPVLCVDLPSGLSADTGQDPMGALTDAGPRHTLSLLTLKPGLFTASGRDAAGSVWYDDLGVATGTVAPPTAWWGGYLPEGADKARDPHVGHKGSYGDVGVIGGQLPDSGGIGMAGAAVLAARAALHAGAGRVYLALVGGGPAPSHDPLCPELMLRKPAALLAADPLSLPVLVVGCGGGEAIREWLSPALACPRLVIDADGLNALAHDPALQRLAQRRQARGWATVLTPHPLEAARLLGIGTAEVMADRLASARQLSERFSAIVVLKGSGTVVAEPGGTPWINATGNARLATAGTGDVLAGMIGAALARPHGNSAEAVRRAVAAHGALADRWPTGHALTAGRLALAAQPL